jgi:formylglycine-generating enzyme required for sulfatase activity
MDMRKKFFISLGTVALLLFAGIGLSMQIWPGLTTFTEEVNPTQTPHPDLRIGSTLISEKDEMAMVFVPAGDFSMGMRKGAANERPEHIVYLDAYWIDQTEVTNEMYRRCVDDGWCTPPQKRSSATRPDYFNNPAFNSFPVIYVDWQQAKEYCEWAGRRLPTEAEWEKAARGTDGQDFPWGNQQARIDLLNFNGELGDTTSVGGYPDGASPYLGLDMAGNVFEWVSDCFDSNYYRYSPRQNPSGPADCDHQHRVIRGGYSWRVPPHESPGIGDRLNQVETATGSDLGFRCAVSAK